MLSQALLRDHDYVMFTDEPPQVLESDPPIVIEKPPIQSIGLSISIRKESFDVSTSDSIRNTTCQNSPAMYSHVHLSNDTTNTTIMNASTTINNNNNVNTTITTTNNNANTTITTTNNNANSNISARFDEEETYHVNHEDFTFMCGNSLIDGFSDYTTTESKETSINDINFIEDCDDDDITDTDNKMMIPYYHVFQIVPKRGVGKLVDVTYNPTDIKMKDIDDEGVDNHRSSNDSIDITSENNNNNNNDNKLNCSQVEVCSSNKMNYGRVIPKLPSVPVKDLYDSTSITDINQHYSSNQTNLLQQPDNSTHNLQLSDNLTHNLQPSDNLAQNLECQPTSSLDSHGIFTIKSSLTKNGETVFKCKKCSTVVMDKKELVEHIRSHITTNVAVNLNEQNNLCHHEKEENLENIQIESSKEHCSKYKISIKKVKISNGGIDNGNGNSSGSSNGSGSTSSNVISGSSLRNSSYKCKCKICHSVLSSTTQSDTECDGICKTCFDTASTSERFEHTDDVIIPCHCGFCGQRFEHIKHLWLHVKIHHDGNSVFCENENKFDCDECNKQYTTTFFQRRNSTNCDNQLAQHDHSKSQTETETTFQPQRTTRNGIDIDIISEGNFVEDGNSIIGNNMQSPYTELGHGSSRESVQERKKEIVLQNRRFQSQRNKSLQFLNKKDTNCKSIYESKEKECDNSQGISSYQYDYHDQDYLDEGVLSSDTTTTTTTITTTTTTTHEYDLNSYNNPVTVINQGKTCQNLNSKTSPVINQEKTCDNLNSSNNSFINQGKTCDNLNSNNSPVKNHGKTSENLSLDNELQGEETMRTFNFNPQTQGIFAVKPIVSETGENMYKCVACTTVLKNVKEVLEHTIGNHMNISNIKQISVGKNTNDLKLHSHEKIVFLGNELQKEENDIIQNRQFGSKYKIPISKKKVYKRKYENEKRFHCGFCKKRFYTSSERYECFALHKGQKPFQCDKCGNSYRHKETLRHHMKTHEDNYVYSIKERKYECQQCNKKFTTNYYLTIHLRVHSGERPFKCNICQKAFKTRRHLVLHEGVHSNKNDWPFACFICGKSFRLKEHFKTHTNYVHGEKSFECHVCKKMFISNSGLKRHLNIHNKKRIA